MIDYSKLKKLRQETGVSFSLCKKALEETDNNIDKAKEVLSLWGAKKLSEKSDRQTSDGAIFSYVHHNKKIAALIEIMCETDFVSSNDEFQRMGQEIAMQAASVPARNVDELLEQDYIRDPGKKIKDLVNDAVLKFGEKITVNRLTRWVLAE